MFATLPNADFLDTLVRLASVGTSGICIFAIFWIGWLVYKMPENSAPERYRTMRLYMMICVAIAIVSAVSGVANSIFNARAVAQVQQKADAIKTEFVAYKETATNAVNTATAAADRIKGEYVAFKKSAETKHADLTTRLTSVLKTAEVSAIEKASPEMRRNLDSLRKAVGIR